MISDKEIELFVNNYYIEEHIRREEDLNLLALKNIFEKDPSEKNNQNWLSYSNAVCERRTAKKQSA